MTSRANVVFTVKEGATGEPSIAIEYSVQNPSMPTGLFGFDLAPSTTLAEAQEIARFMNRTLKSFAHTP